MSNFNLNVHRRESGDRPSLRFDFPDGRRFELTMGVLANDCGHARTQIARWAEQWARVAPGTPVTDPLMGMLPTLESPQVSV